MTAEEVVNLFEKDVSARKRLAELLISEPDIRLAIINAVLRDVATKQDIDELRKATKQDMDELRREMKEELASLKVATKQDIDELRKATKQDMDELRREIETLRKDVNELKERVSGLEASSSLLVKVFMAVNVPILIAIIGLLLKFLLIP